jgi:hypothetical protein
MLIKDAVFVYHLQEPEDINWHGRYHYHGNGEYEIHYFLGGDGSFLNGSRKYALEPGTLFISPPGVKHRIEARDVSRPITYYAILMELGEADEEFRALFTDEIKWNRKHAIGDRYRFFFEELREKTFSANPHLRCSGDPSAGIIYISAGLRRNRKSHRVILRTSTSRRRCAICRRGCSSNPAVRAGEAPGAVPGASDTAVPSETEKPRR